MADDTKFLSRTYRGSNFRYESAIFKMLDHIGCLLNENEIKLLTILAGSVLEPRVQRKINNGKDLFTALSKRGYCDESNFHSLIEVMKILHRYDIVHMLHLQKQPKVSLDPVEEYLKNVRHIVPRHNVDPILSCSKSSHKLRISGRDIISGTGTSMSTDDSFQFSGSIPPPSKRLRRSQRISTRSFLKNEAERKNSRFQKNTCDVRLRVRAEYCDYDNILQGNVSSMKPDRVDRELECFSQASAILRTRDLGFIICDIKFSEVTYLDAFWRDYLNGSLLEALKGVFITESLKQAVGNEAIKLLVNVDEGDYEKGRLILMKNLNQPANEIL